MGPEGKYEGTTVLQPFRLEARRHDSKLEDRGHLRRGGSVSAYTLAIAITLVMAPASAQNAHPLVVTLDPAAARAIINAAQQVAGNRVSQVGLLSLREYSVAVASTDNTVTATLGSPQRAMHYSSSISREGATQNSSQGMSLTGNLLEALVAATASWKADVARQEAPSKDALREVEIVTPIGSQSRIIVTFRYLQAPITISNGRVTLACDKALSYTVWLATGMVTKNRAAECVNTFETREE